jgi:hypothetical protein
VRRCDGRRARCRRGTPYALRHADRHTARTARPGR